MRISGCIFECFNVRIRPIHLVNQKMTDTKTMLLQNLPKKTKKNSRTKSRIRIDFRWRMKMEMKMKIIHYSFIILGTKYACCLLTNAFVNLILFFVMGLEKTTQKPPNYSAMGMDAIRMCIYIMILPSNPSISLKFTHVLCCDSHLPTVCTTTTDLGLLCIRIRIFVMPPLTT